MTANADTYKIYNKAYNHAPVQALREGLVLHWLEHGNTGRAEALATCGKVLFPDLPREHPAYGYRAHCGLAECPVCRSEAVRAWQTQAARVDSRLSSSGLKTRMVTFSLPDVSTGAELREAVQDLSVQHSALLKRRPYQRLVRGAARGLEVSEADTGALHPHVHAVFLLNAGNGEELADFFPRGAYLSEPQDDVHLAQLGGYLSKLPTTNPEVWLNITGATKGKRFVSLSGDFRTAWRDCSKC